MNYPKHLLKLIESFKKLPGVGSKSAERYAFEMLKWRPEELSSLAHLIAEIPTKLTSCPECGCIQGDESCVFCKDERKRAQTLCILASPKDAFSIESTHEFRGLYHVLGALISPLDGIGPEELDLPKLLHRIDKYKIQEVVLAIDSSIEGDSTALYLKRELSTLPLKVTRLAFGIPMGSALDYVDGGTLARALVDRSNF